MKRLHGCLAVPTSVSSETTPPKLMADLLLQYFDAVGWVFWPVKPTTESENRLQLDSVSTFVYTDCLTMVDNTSAVGNDSSPWVVPQSIKWLSTITRQRCIPPDSESGGIPHLFGTSVPPYRQCLTGSSWQQQQQQQQQHGWFWKGPYTFPRYAPGFSTSNEKTS